MKFLAYIVPEGEIALFPYAKLMQSTTVSFQSVPLNLMRQEVCMHFCIRLLANLSFQSDEFSESQSSVGPVIYWE